MSTAKQLVTAKDFNDDLDLLIGMLLEDLGKFRSATTNEAQADLAHIQLQLRLTTKVSPTVVIDELIGGHYLDEYESHLLNCNRAFIDDMNLDTLKAKIELVNGQSWLNTMFGLKTVWDGVSESRKVKLWNKLLDIYAHYLNYQE
jgi:hypothetical protein